MQKLDTYYTPRVVAEAMVAAVTASEPARIADFAVGDGSLLRAAWERWPSAELIGTDVARRPWLAVGSAPWHGCAVFGQCDFLSDRSRSASPVLRKLEEAIDVILLNPPFSARGGTRWEVAVADAVVGCSRALAFVYRSLKYLHANGELVAVLPASTLSSERDAPLWAAIAAHKEVTVVDEFPRGAFAGCTARTVIVHLRKGEGAPFIELPTIGAGRLACQVKVVRGTAQMHAVVPGSGIPLVHTTDIRRGRIDRSVRRVDEARVTTRGPAVLLPRVGKPLPEKCAVLARGRIAISDCVFSLECDSLDNARRLAQRLVEHWPQVARLYAGACAPYLTKARLIQALRGLGANVSPDR